MMKVYTSFLALSKGIIAITRPHKFWDYKDYMELDEPIDNVYRIHKKYCHESFEDAVKQANLMKKNRIKQLQKEIDKIKDIEFINTID